MLMYVVPFYRLHTTEKGTFQVLLMIIVVKLGSIFCMQNMKRLMHSKASKHTLTHCLFEN